MFELKEENGIILERGVKLAVDSTKSVEADYKFISHAHSDHAKISKKNNARIFLSEATYALLSDKFDETIAVEKIPLNKKTELYDFSFTFHNSGHILGAVQIEFNAEKTIVLTNDMKLQDSIIQKGAPILNSDVLVIESTFGLPEFVFPEREEVYNEIGKWISSEAKKNNFIVLAGYSLGKAQELTKIVNEYSNETPLVYEKAFEFNSVYKNKGINLGEFIKLDHNLKDSNVLIIPPHLVEPGLTEFLELSLNKKVVSGIATGWSYRKGFDKLFPLSDHSDFKQLIEYIECSNPKMVLTTHGFAKEFSHHVSKKLKIPSKPLNEFSQKNLFEFGS